MQHTPIDHSDRITAAIEAPKHWRVVELISDLHLQASEPATFQAWRHYMYQLTADAVFILGDLFEVWVGDDMAQPGSFEADCAQVLKEAANRSQVYFLPGNRDFLIGDTFSQRCGFQLISDPTVLSWHGRRWVLSHGDELCLGDAEYLQFRKEVRSPQWQTDFKSRPLHERLAVAKRLRNQSRMRQQDLREAGQAYPDIDVTAATELLLTAGSDCLIHGHTHKPAQHELGDGRSRSVLSDWDLSARPPRAEIMRLSCHKDPLQEPQFTLQRIPLAQTLHYPIQVDQLPGSTSSICQDSKKSDA